MLETKRPLKVFLCHAHSDKSVVRNLYLRLIRDGVDAWLDKEKLLPGQDWEYEIRKAVHESDVVVVCMSKQFNQAGFRQKEVRLALETAMEQPEGEIFIIPARLEECDTIESLKKWHWVDLFEDDGYQRLVQALRERAHRIGATLQGKRAWLPKITPSSMDRESKATPKVIPEEVRHEKATQEKAIEKTVKYQDAIKTRIRESFITFSTRLNSKFSEVIELQGARRVQVFTGIFIVLAMLSVSSWLTLRKLLPLSAVAADPTMTPATSVEPATDVLPVPTDTAHPSSVETSTEAVVTTENSTSASVPVLGGADKIAFVANRDIWLMNVDGSELKQLTDDGGVKSDLQWLPDGEIITFISGLTIKYVNITSGNVEALTNFPTASSLNAFRVSHDGRQVMISLNNEIFVVPFDFEQFKNVHKKSDLLALDGCIFPEPKTKSILGVREALWSEKDDLVTWLFKGVDPARSPRLLFDQASVLDISKCIPAEIDQLENFPAERFKPVNVEPVEYNDDGTIPGLDWDGNELFVFNTSRQDGWGELYIYNWNTKRPVHNNFIDDLCCYRDARWSPDGLYLFFAFRDHRLGDEAQTRLYYVLYREGAGRQFEALPLPEGFFIDRTEAPQPALRSAQ
jgi:hypothetical protein